jgi:hypothetical protein
MSHVKFIRSMTIMSGRQYDVTTSIKVMLRLPVWSQIGLSYYDRAHSLNLVSEVISIRVVACYICR